MKKIILIALLILFVLMPMNVFALTAEFSAEKTSVECGDTVLVDIVYRDKSVGAVRAAFTYDDAILEYVGGEGSTAAGGRGTVVLLTSSASATALKTTLEFRAVHAGVVDLTLSTKEALSFEEQPLELPEAQLTLKVRKSADSYVVVTAGGVTMHALCEPPYIPVGYGQKEIKIAGKTVIAVSAGDRDYIYLTLPEETEGAYYFRGEGEYLPAIELKQESILLPFPEEEIPAGWKKDNLRIGKMDVEICTDGEEYLACTMDKDGNKKISAIDSESGILGSKKQLVLTNTKHIEKQAEYNYMMLYVLGSVLIVLLIAVIIAAICKKNR